MTPEQRAVLFSTLPATQLEAIILLNQLDAVGLDFHLDDSPEDICSLGLRARTFSAPEALFLRMLVTHLNELFRHPHNISRNYGAWEAATRAGWLPPDDIAPASDLTVVRNGDKLYGFPTLAAYMEFARANESEDRTCWYDYVYQPGTGGVCEEGNQLNMETFNRFVDEMSRRRG